MQKIALITGSNKGIGLEVARQLGQRGIQVLLGVRDTTKGEAAADALHTQSIEAEVIALDTTSEASVAANGLPKLEIVDFSIKPRRLFVDGKWRESQDGKTRPTINPCTEKENTQISNGNRRRRTFKASAKAPSFPPSSLRSTRLSPTLLRCGITL